MSDNKAQEYISMIEAAENAAKYGLWEQEEEIVKEMEQLWESMSYHERNDVDIMLGYNLWG